MFNSVKKFGCISIGLAIFVPINLSLAEECPSKPCLQDLPKLSQSETVEIEHFYDQYDNGDEKLVKLHSYLCDAVANFNGLVKMKMRPGALTTEENGELKCDPSFCAGDRSQACLIKLTKSYETTCNYEEVSIEKMKKCIEKKKADGILKKNGKRRRHLKIPDCRVPAFAFNGKYDLCGHFESYADLEAYICGLYDHQVPLCC